MLFYQRQTAAESLVMQKALCLPGAQCTDKAKPLGAWKNILAQRNHFMQQNNPGSGNEPEDKQRSRCIKFSKTIRQNSSDNLFCTHPDTKSELRYCSSHLNHKGGI
jgi:hypothetical protein